MQPNDIATIASAIFAGVSALVAAAAIYFPWRLQQNHELLSQAVLSLERAYIALSNNGQNVHPPLANRLNWLTCARHIEAYKMLKKLIKTNLHRSLCEEHEEFWRHQIYICLDMRAIRQTSYFDEAPPPERISGIEPRSAIIIYCFASWSKTKPDPIEEVDIQALIKEYDPLTGNIGLRTYIQTKHPHILCAK
ncbi:hypothetical protein [Duganella sp. BuS-21]|uniref:hypothetical protein n=1 Tax=Duganella sp. BuS-21 TaxID=2943848 RepID=UPI0035A6B1B7